MEGAKFRQNAQPSTRPGVILARLQPPKVFSSLRNELVEIPIARLLTSAREKLKKSKIKLEYVIENLKIHSFQF